MKRMVIFGLVSVLAAVSAFGQQARQLTVEEYHIGDFGPAGGIVFYDKGVVTAGWRYLEAAPVETEFTAPWGAYQKNVGGTSGALGTNRCVFAVDRRRTYRRATM